MVALARDSGAPQSLTNRIAIVLALLIAAGVAVDLVLRDGAGSLFLLRKLADLVEWVAFWR